MKFKKYQNGVILKNRKESTEVAPSINYMGDMGQEINPTVETPDSQIDWKNVIKQNHLKILAKKQKTHDKRRKELRQSIDTIVKDDNTPNKLSLRRMLDLTAFMENSFGHNTRAYSSDYTNSQMQVDDIAVNTLLGKTKQDILDKKTGEVIGQKEGNYTTNQKKYFEKMKKYGFDKETIRDSLKEDNPLAAILMSRFHYASTPEALPTGDNWEDYFNYYQNHYKKEGEVDPDRFKEAWDLMMKGEFNN